MFELFATMLKRQDSGYHRIALSPDNQYLAVDQSSKLLVYSFDNLSNPRNIVCNRQRCFTFSPDSEFLIFYDVDLRALCVYNLNTETIVRQIPHQSFITSVALSADKKFLFTGQRRTFKVWNFDTLELKHEIQ
jgi:WD40 repeat protein